MVAVPLACPHITLRVQIFKIFGQTNTNRKTINIYVMNDKSVISNRVARFRLSQPKMKLAKRYFWASKCDEMMGCGYDMAMNCKDCKW